MTAPPWSSGWVDRRDCGAVFDHEGSLPHPAEDREGPEKKSPAGRGLTQLALDMWRQPFSRGRITLPTRQELRMGFDTTARYHRDRAAQFRSHAERARLAETREMYLRLARAETTMAEMAERRQSEGLAAGQLTPTIPQDPKKPNGEG